MSLLLLGSWSALERDQWLSLLQPALPGECWILDVPLNAADAAEVEAAIVANPAPGSLGNLPRLRLIQSVWAGVDKLLADPGLPADVPVARMVDPAMNEAMVHTALWAVLSLHRRFFELAAQQAQAIWRQPEQLRAADWQVLVLGLGELGGRVARSLAAQGYAVSAWSTRPAVVEGVQCFHTDASLVQALARADTVVNLLPLTVATQGFFDAARLAQMKHGASLVNLARGAHVVEADLLQALEAGHLRHAVLDVFAQEPLPPQHPFWQHPQITVLPHCAAQTDPRSALAVVVGNLRALREGRPLQHLVQRQRGY
ncbi:2-hydroxyacid dehydrogenase [Roseateles koreensis]|uniref:Glyoxylate/hydroxypyruvate reductase A n=1 Tax=Roseateles koreensis TaxID=2987526 RepID=A0ABT5KVQ1_9BURK|nr:glyoxylate/hydroxypyruvate reductase A [Roseateles koreensis]MDC8787009.1 glyoxylate/hydroxypyruvate reductase A [Roseateles koreensis]